MTGYYAELLDELTQMKEENPAGALERINQELSMPYVPKEAEEKLIALRKDLVFLLSEEKDEKEISLSGLLKRLKGTPQQQLFAASRLSERNLRDLLDEIKEYLANEPCPEAAAILIEALALQDIRDEFVLVKDNVEYTFWSDSVEPVSSSKGYRKADQYLKDWLENDHPDFYRMCRTLLVHKVYLLLPLSLETEEAEDTAQRILKEVSEMMDDGKIYDEIIQQGEGNEDANADHHRSLS